MSKIKIVVADNNRELCTSLSGLISLQDDMELTGVAYDGIEALQLVESIKPHVLVLDITMPYLDGIGVLERLGELPDRPIVIVLTAFEQESMIQRLISLGATYYMVKPFDAPTLFERIRQFAAGQPSPFKPAKVATDRPVIANHARREKTESELELEVSKLFHEMGIPAHFRGYAYLRDAIIIAAKEVEVLGNITKNLYPRIADKYRSTPSGVESAIRHTIEIGWERGNSEFMENFFGFDNKKGRFPTTASFVAKIADKLRLESKIV
ncbi:response regulator receiver protein [Hydrogenispora ethanolica]|jgi:two-component system response regulator (stage 0 sporulation protein A)|uniref:Stage 0 sporulation protein A homolog n=1 Tax=Hydrogenispora ethanolica TaxID=1082276 RepID=A0A4R1R903_HYDET|nr:sporulation transcription factor Spo0A [Hydrogenispora ethanolica]TCL62098.1 response regulator receiver protein [Hydrogenispora ethanolica]